MKDPLMKDPLMKGPLMKGPLMKGPLRRGRSPGPFVRFVATSLATLLAGVVGAILRYLGS